MATAFVDPGREFTGAATKEIEKHKTNIRRGRMDIYRHQAIVERFNRTLAERLFGHQYAVEMRLPNGDFRMGRSASCCGLRSERRSHSLDWQEAC